MKSICTLVLISLMATNTYGQQATEQVRLPIHPQQRLNVGMVFSDFLIARFKMEMEYRIMGSSAIALGIGTHLGMMDMDNRPFMSNRHNANDIYADLGYKYYFARTHGGHFPFARVSLAYQNSDVEYTEKSWVPQISDGSTYYYYRDVDKYYHVENVSLGMEVGIQFIQSVFFSDVSAGLQYKNVISADTPPEEFTYYNGHFFDDIDYTGIAPRIRVKLGFYLD